MTFISSRSRKFSYYINLEKQAPGSPWEWTAHTKYVCLKLPTKLDPDGPGQPHSHNPY